MGYWLLDMGYGLLAIGYWRQSRISVPLHSTPYALHQKRQRPRLYTLRFTLLAPAPLPLTSRL